MEIDVDQFIKREKRRIEDRHWRELNEFGFFVDMTAKNLNLMNRLVFFQPGNNLELHGSEAVFGTYYDVARSAVVDLYQALSNHPKKHYNNPRFHAPTIYPWIIPEPNSGIIALGNARNAGLEAALRLEMATMKPIPRNSDMAVLVMPSGITERLRSLYTGLRYATTPEELDKFYPLKYRLALTSKGEAILERYLAIVEIPNYDVLPKYAAAKGVL